ncbi:MAG: hypothetical protein ACYTG1_09755 [Planctomycetota bacterium]|jgi:hypothetical protein
MTTSQVRSVVRGRAGAVLAMVIGTACAVCGVRAEPPGGDGGDPFALAVRALEEDRAADAWWHVRQAVRADPGRLEASRLFEAMWHALDEQGHLNAGRTVPDVVEHLGPPDGRRARGSQSRLEYGFMALDFRDGALVAAVDLRGLPVEAIRPREEVRLESDGRPWRLGHRQVGRTQVNAEYVLPGETVQAWTELLSVQRLVGLAERDLPLRLFAEGMRSAFRQQAPDGTWRVLRDGPTEIVYEFIVPAGGDHPAQHEVARLILGEHDIHRVAYSRKGGAMTDADRDAWIDVLARAELGPVSGTAAATPAPATPTAAVTE